MEKRIENSKTLVTKLILPNDMNTNCCFFGGEALKIMDEIAFITAKKFAQKNVVTVSVENVKFIKPIKQGEIIEFLGSIENFDKLKIFVKIEVFRDCINNNDKEKVLESHFIMVCVDENNRLLRLK